MNFSVYFQQPDQTRPSGSSPPRGRNRPFRSATRRSAVSSSSRQRAPLAALPILPKSRPAPRARENSSPNAPYSLGKTACHQRALYPGNQVGVCVLCVARCHLFTIVRLPRTRPYRVISSLLPCRTRPLVPLLLCLLPSIRLFHTLPLSLTPPPIRLFPPHMLVV